MHAYDGMYSDLFFFLPFFSLCLFLSACTFNRYLSFFSSFVSYCFFCCSCSCFVYASGLFDFNVNYERISNLGESTVNTVTVVVDNLKLTTSSDSASMRSSSTHDNRSRAMSTGRICLADFRS